MGGDYAVFRLSNNDVLLVNVRGKTTQLLSNLNERIFEVRLSSDGSKLLLLHSRRMLIVATKDIGESGAAALESQVENCELLRVGFEGR